MIYFASSTSTVFKFLHASLDPASCLLAAIYDSLLAFPHLFYHIFPPLDSTRDLVTVHLSLATTAATTTKYFGRFSVSRCPVTWQLLMMDIGQSWPYLMIYD